MTPTIEVILRTPSGALLRADATLDDRDQIIVSPAEPLDENRSKQFASGGERPKQEFKRWPEWLGRLGPRWFPPAPWPTLVRWHWRRWYWPLRIEWPEGGRRQECRCGCMVKPKNICTALRQSSKMIWRAINS